MIVGHSAAALRATGSGAVALQTQKILAHLGKRFQAGDYPLVLNSLQSARWLPARGKADRWYRPAIRRTMLPNSRRVRWLSASSSQ